MFDNRDFLVFSLQPWHTELGTSVKGITLELSKTNRVLFINYPVLRSDLIRNNKSKKNELNFGKAEAEEPIQQINENLWVFTCPKTLESINWISPTALYQVFNYYNHWVFCTEILRAAKKLKFKNYFLLNDNSMLVGYYFKEFLKPALSMYFLRDNVIVLSYHKKHGTSLQKGLLAKTDLVATNCPTFENYALEVNPHSFMAGQGFDSSTYDFTLKSFPIASDLEKVKQKGPLVIGYAGFLTTRRLDIDLMVYLATHLPDFSLVLVGPEDEDFQKSALHELSNVFFLGRKTPEELPNYLIGFDVAINPQIKNEITECNYPLKADEYLAMGLPVVATGTEFMKFYFSEFTYLADSSAEFVNLIKKAVEENNMERKQLRNRFAKTHTWGNFLKKIDDKRKLYFPDR